MTTSRKEGHSAGRGKGRAVLQLMLKDLLKALHLWLARCKDLLPYAHSKDDWTVMLLAELTGFVMSDVPWSRAPREKKATSISNGNLATNREADLQRCGEVGNEREVSSST